MSANQSIVRNVHRKVLSHPSKIALDDGSTAVAYAELWARVEAVAGWIAARTLPGDRVIIQQQTLRRLRRRLSWQPGRRDRRRAGQPRVHRRRA